MSQPVTAAQVQHFGVEPALPPFSYGPDPDNVRASAVARVSIVAAHW